MVKSEFKKLIIALQVRGFEDTEIIEILLEIIK